MADRIVGIDIMVLRQADIEQNSAGKISLVESTDENKTGSFSALELGTTSSKKVCRTCECSMDGSEHQCPGHFGHIELYRPIYLFQFLSTTVELLQSVCNACSKLYTQPDAKFRAKFAKAIRQPPGPKRMRAILDIQKNIKHCEHCDVPKAKIKKDDKPNIGIVAEMLIPIDNGLSFKTMRTSISPDQAWLILSKIDADDLRTLGFDPTKFDPSDVIGRHIPVAPPHVRPMFRTPDGKFQDDDITHKDADILKADLKMRSDRDQRNNYANSLMKLIAYHQATRFDNKTNMYQSATKRNNQPFVSIKERLDGKKGLVRGNIMGKRVDHCARSVITPNATCRIDEVVIPGAMAQNLTVPEIVTERNRERLSALVRNREDYPGARFVEFPRKGETKNLQYAEGDIDLRPGDIVHRHLQTGDMLLLNRQPTLHKPGMMGMRAKVRTKCDDKSDIMTISFKTPVCKPYNADFDGDEMNLHVPQSSAAAFELELIAALPLQIISIAHNAPLISLHMDTRLGAWCLTAENRTFTRRQVANIIGNTSLDFRRAFSVGGPAGPERPMLSGHEVFSMILPTALTMHQGDTLIKCGKLVRGAITKSISGDGKRNNIFHRIWDLKNPYRCCDVLNDATMVANQYLLQRGFTISLKDIVVSKEVSLKIKQLVRERCENVNRLYQNAENEEKQMDVVEHMIQQELSAIREECGELIVAHMDANNNLFAMAKGAGSKGGITNIASLSGVLGQQDYSVRKKDTGRMPMDYNGRTLPYYSQGDYSAQARGFVARSFLEGLTPTEFFAHAQSGRVGLIDTAVKTANSGYMQRRLIKSIESIMFCYDGSVRAANGDLIQAIYGENNVDPQNMYENRLLLPQMSDKAIHDSYVFTAKELDKYPQKQKARVSERLMDLTDPYPDRASSPFGLSESKAYGVRMVRYKREIINHLCRLYFNRPKVPDRILLCLHFDQLITTCRSNNLDMKAGDKDELLSPGYVLKQLNALLDDPMLSQLQISEQDIRDKTQRYKRNRQSLWFLERMLHTYLAPKRCIVEYQLSRRRFDRLIRMVRSKLARATLDPGTMVGIWAAQSIGEPLTQMTLNTFHHAGVGNKGVGSLGIERLKELLAVSGNQKRPGMYVYLNREYENNFEVADLVAKNMSEIYLSDVVEGEACIINDPTHEYARKDEVSRIYKVFTFVDRMPGASELGDMNFVLRVPLSRELLFENKLTLWTIRLEFVRFWRRLATGRSQSMKKRMRAVLDNVISCAFLSNSELSERPVLHIRMSLRRFDYVILEELVTIFMSRFKVRGLDGITDARVKAITNRYVDDDGVLREEAGKGSKRCYMIECDGINVTDIARIRYVDMTRTTSNDVWVQFITLGIEAVRSMMLRELRQVSSEFEDILYHHLSILVDYMTHVGSLIPISRHGVNRLDRDVLARASFEQTTDTLTKAAIWSKKDRMETVSSNIAVGNRLRIGTGYPQIKIDFSTFDKIPVSKLAINEDELDVERDAVTEHLLRRPLRPIFVPTF